MLTSACSKSKVFHCALDHDSCRDVASSVVALGGGTLPNTEDARHRRSTLARDVCRLAAWRTLDLYRSRQGNESGGWHAFIGASKRRGSRTGTRSRCTATMQPEPTHATPCLAISEQQLSLNPSRRATRFPLTRKRCLLSGKLFERHTSWPCRAPQIASPL